MKKKYGLVNIMVIHLNIPCNCIVYNFPVVGTKKKRITEEG